MARRNGETRKECLAKEAAEKVPNAKRRMNTKFVEVMTPSLLSEIDANDEETIWLKAIGEAPQDSNG